MSRKTEHPVPDPDAVGLGGSRTETGPIGIGFESKSEDPVTSGFNIG